MKKIITSVLFLTLLVGVLVLVSNLVERKSSIQKDGEFYTQKEEFDVLFFGSSHMLNGVAPMELWNEYGIVSYDLAHDSEFMAGSYWDLKNAIRYHKPKVVVIDMFLLEMNDKIGRDETKSLSYAHKIFDSMPLSLTKGQAAFDLVTDKKESLQLLFNFSLYHSRWNELVQEDFNTTFLFEKGAQSRVAVTSTNNPEIVLADECNEVDSVSVKYLKKMIELCQKEGIEVLLVNLPYPADAVLQKNSNYASVIAEKYQITYLNLIEEKELINYKTDMSDYGHLNPSGARKVSTWLGAYLQDNYSLPDHRTDKEYNYWNKDYQEFKDMKVNNLKNCELFEYFMLLDDDSYSTILMGYGGVDLWKDSLLVNLLTNLGATITADQIDTLDSNYFVIFDHKNDQVIETTKNELQSFETSFGQVGYFYENGQQMVGWKGQTTDFLMGKGAIRCIVIDNETGETVDSVIFSADGTATR